MADMSDNTLIIVAAVVVLVLLIAIWIMRRPPTERIRTQTPDVLTPGAAQAQRNTLLVEAPPAVAPPAGVIVGGIGEVVSAAAAQEATAASPAPRPFFPMGEMARTAMEDNERERAEAEAALPPAPADDLTRIKGLGPKLAALLRTQGITRFEQVAGWSEADAARIDVQLGAFQGRIARDAWIEQARYLAAGDVAGFEARFGKV